VVRARSISTATVAASKAAPVAIRVICQPGMPPATMVGRPNWGTSTSEASSGPRP
jgi:hypothetical protein